ncbi:MAG: PLP-dependent aminotransferase family protein [SAR202 cluster bacterium]|nr:PLP-dependent aminotransferase family protein [SAR202 cluster bacterium]
MGEARHLDFERLYAKTAPPPRDRTVVKRGKYDFAIAYPDPHSLPLDDLVESLREALDEEGANLAVYPHLQGYPPLRQYVAEKLARERAINVSPDDIILGDGSSQPIYMALEALLDVGDVVLTEDYFYQGTLVTMRRFRADVRGIPCDADGMLPDALDSAIVRAQQQGKRPKLIYTIPTYHNPQGWTMPFERRKAIVRVAQKHGVPILEDDCYVDLRYDGDVPPSLWSLDGAGHVMYVSSFSKTIAPGMRIGYIAAPTAVVDRLRAVKSGSGVNQFTALAVHRYALKHLDKHIPEINDVQRARRDAMLAALGENFGSQATWSRPMGGLFIWLKMAEGTDLVKLRDIALKDEVGYIPGPMFAPDGVTGKNYARLCFGYNTPEEIHEGIARLADVFAREGALQG